MDGAEALRRIGCAGIGDGLPGIFDPGGSDHIGRPFVRQQTDTDQIVVATGNPGSGGAVRACRLPQATAEGELIADRHLGVGLGSEKPLAPEGAVPEAFAGDLQAFMEQGLAGATGDAETASLTWFRGAARAVGNCVEDQIGAWLVRDEVTRAHLGKFKVSLQNKEAPLCPCA